MKTYQLYINGEYVDAKANTTIDVIDPATTEVIAKTPDAGAQDVKAEDGLVEVYTDFTELKTVEEALRGQGLSITGAERTMVPKTTLQLEGDKVNSNLRLIEKLEELDDVQQVFTNLELSEEQLAALG